MYTNIHTHTISNKYNEVSICNMYHDQDHNKKGKYSVAIHPWHIERTVFEMVLNELETVAEQKNIFAIGETGLDKSISTPLQLQEIIFKRQIKIAQTVNKPLIIHCVRAFPELISQLNNVTVPVIIHGFRGSMELVKELIKHGFYISFGTALLSPSEKLLKAFISVPTNKLFLETDDTDLNIEDIYAGAAKIKSCSVTDLQNQLFQNYQSVFEPINSL